MIPMSKPVLDWNGVVGNLEPVGPVSGFCLLFKPWHTIIAPDGTPSAMTSGKGKPLYRYQILWGSTRNLSMEPSPGFPGS